MSDPIEVPPDMAICRELASALRAGDDSAAAGLAGRAGIPPWLLTHPELGPRGRLDTGDAGEALWCISVLTAGSSATLVPWLGKPAVIDLVAEAVETAAAPGTTAGHPWARGMAALEEWAHPAIPMLLRARAEEGAGRSDQARQLIESCLRLDPDLRPAIRDALEYELCAGNWARAWELASAMGDDDIAEPLLRPLDRLRQPARGAERAARNQPCPCGSGRKYKVCCRVRDLDGGVHPLPHRAPALYAMLATYARRGPNRKAFDRMAACVIGAPHAAMLALDLAIFDDGGAARRFLAARGHMLRDDERALLGEWLAEPVDMYEVSSVKRGSELTLRSLVGGPQRVGQRDRMFSLSVRRLDVVIGPLLPRNTPDEIEYAGEVQPGRLTNLGTIRRGRTGFTVNANSVRRAADLEAVVLAAASAAGCPAHVTRRSALTADELAGTPPEAENGPDSREAACQRLGIEGVSSPEQRRLILEGYFLPVEHGLDDVAREINRELGYLSVLESRDEAGMTPAEAVAADGAAVDRVLAMIDDCEWRLRRAEAEDKDTGMLPDPGELRRRLGIPAGSRRAVMSH